MLSKFSLKPWSSYPLDEFMLFLSYMDCTSMRVLSLVILIILINVDITAVSYIVLYFVYTLWVFRVLIWIVNWVWHVQCQICDNVHWINGNELNSRFFTLTMGLFNNGRLQGVTGQKTFIWTQHYENLKLIYIHKKKRALYLMLHTATCLKIKKFLRKKN